MQFRLHRKGPCSNQLLRSRLRPCRVFSLRDGSCPLRDHQPAPRKCASSRARQGPPMVRPSSPLSQGPVLRAGQKGRRTTAPAFPTHRQETSRRKPAGQMKTFPLPTTPLLLAPPPPPLLPRPHQAHLAHPYPLSRPTVESTAAPLQCPPAAHQTRQPRWSTR